MSNPNLVGDQVKENERPNKQANDRALAKAQNKTAVSTEVETMVNLHAPPQQQLEVLKAILKELKEIKGRL